MTFKGVDVHDAASLVETNGMWMPCRVDAKTFAALPDKTKTRALTTTGVELRFCVRSGEVKLVMGGLDEKTHVDCRVYRGDVICDWPGTTRTVAGTNAVWTFGKSPVAHLRRRAEKFGCRYDPEMIRIVLPPTGRIGLRDVIGAAEPPTPEMLPKTTYLAYGSSITHGSDSLLIERSYAALVGEALGADVRNLGLAGCARMENEVADFIANEKGLDWISLEMGVNVVGTMPVDEYERRVRYMVRRVATAHPKARVLAIDVYRCEGSPDRQRKAQAFRDTLARVVRELDLPNVVRVNGLDALPEKDSLSTGSLHPSPKGHEAIAAHLVARFRDPKAGWRVDSPECVLRRFHREFDGTALRRLPTWVVPENAFICLNNDDFDIPDSWVEDRRNRALDEESDFNCVTYSLRCVPDLSDARVQARVAKTAAALRKAGVDLLMDVDPRIFRNEFLKRWPQDALHVRELALVEPKYGVAAFSVTQDFMRDHMCYGTAPYSGYRPVRLVGVWAAKGGDVTALREAAAEGVVATTNAISGTVRGLAADEKLLVEVDYELKEADLCSPHLVEMTREMSLRYRELGAAATMRDEWGFCVPRKAMCERRAFWYSAPFAADYARLSGGRDLAKDLPLLAYGVKSAEKSAAIDAYQRTIYDRCKATEEDFYRSNKEHYGTDAYVTKHATWGTGANPGEFCRNGFSWWAATRDWAQGDESSRVPVLNGMAKKFGGPLWMNEGYGGPSELHYPKTLWRYVLAGGRMVYHGIVDRRNKGTDPQEFRYRRFGDFMRRECLRAEEIARLLPLVTRSQIDCPTAFVFGHARLVNWDDPGYRDWGEAFWTGLGMRGHYADVYPASEFEGATFSVDADGVLRVGQQRYAALVLHHLSDGERANWEKLVAGRTLATKVFVEPEMEDVAAYLESVGAVRQTPLDEKGFRGRKDSPCKLPLPDGTLTLIDGTVVRVKGANPEVTGDPIEGELDVGGMKITYAATGLFAARTDKDGKLTALAAGRLRRVSLPGFTLALDNPEDVALVKIGPAWFGTWQTGDTSAEVPAALRAITPNWVKLAAPGLRR